MRDGSSIEFFFQKKPVFLRNRSKLKSFLQTMLKREGRKLAHLGFVFCSDAYLLQINLDFLQHDFYTDIISFDLSGQQNPLEGEIYISVDRVQENAKTNGTSFTNELHRVIFHGVLHFCGYKDKKASEEKLMRKMEEHYLARYFK